MKKYHLDEIDVSKLPLRLREYIEKGLEKDRPYKMIGAIKDGEEPSLNEETGEHYSFWMLATTIDGSGAFSVVRTPSVSSRVGEYLESIRINKNGY